jgi:glycosyltransferase involved in cell wall biosynthesis
VTASARPVAQVVPYYPPHLGGLEVVAKALAEGLSARRPVEVVTSSIAPEKAPRTERNGRLRVRRLTAIELAHIPLMPTLLWHLLRLPRRTILHAHAAVAFCPEMAWAAARLHRSPFVVHFHLDADPTGRLGPLYLLYKRHILGRVLRAATCVIAVSPDQPDFLIRTHGVAPDRIMLIPNGIGEEFQLGLRAEMPSDRTFQLLFVGRLVPQKNASLLLRAASLMNEKAEITIVGDGEERGMLERLAVELDLTNLTFAGIRKGSELVDAYRQADGFVLTSVKESTGLVLLEAMAAGLPIVSVDVPGAHDTVGNDGVLVAPEPAALAAALDRLIAEPEHWCDLARRSAARADQHSWTGPLAALNAMYDELPGE